MNNRTHPNVGRESMDVSHEFGLIFNPCIHDRNAALTGRILQ